MLFYVMFLLGRVSKMNNPAYLLKITAHNIKYIIKYKKNLLKQFPIV